MRAILIGAVVAAAACSGPSKQTREPAAGAPVLAVLTYNVNFGIGGDLDTVDVIRNADADLVLLQETTPEWEASLRQELAKKYPYMMFKHPDRYPAGGFAVLSRQPFSDEDLIPSPSGWFPGWRVVADTPLGKVQVLNVHLRPPLSDRGSLAMGYFSTKKDREKEIAAYYAELDPTLPTLVAGDFNEDEHGRAVSFLASRDLASALPQFQPDQPTWHWNTSLGPIHSRLDHIVYDEKAFAPLDIRVIEGGNSDHYGVVARFEKKN